MVNNMSDNDKPDNKYSVDDILEEARQGAADIDDSEYYDSDIGFDEPVEEEIPKKKRKLFGRKKDKRSDFDEREDLYYGIQLKPLDEFRKGFDSTGEIPSMDDTFAKLFDDTIPSLDEEVEKNFTRIQQERRRRVAEAVETAGINVDDVADELGIVAPMPVTSFAADPYARQHGIGVNDGEEQEDNFQKAMYETAKSQTMEIKLNVLNDTVELQKNLNVPAVDDDTVNQILKSVSGNTQELPPLPEKEEQKSVPVPANRGTYRDKGLPVHFLNIDIVQSALISESAGYEEKAVAKPTPFKRFAAIEGISGEGEPEQIDDYTSPADAKSIAHELKGTMSRLSVRMLVTGLSTLVMFIASLICEGGKGTPASIAYLIITLIFLGLSIGFNYRNILNGLKSLMEFRPNSDSAAAVASAAVGVQTIVGFFAIDKIADGSMHIFGAIAAGILLVNIMGKVSMVRRIYGNFRFITAREQKYAVKNFTEYNTALKLAKDSVAGAPQIVYQQKAGFLKRFLQLSYNPDPSETTSQSIAPFGLVASLILCIAVMLITKDIAAGITAFAAGACVSTCTTNMLSLNMPMGKLCKKARRGGAMVVGYDGIKAMADTNAVMMDAADLFPLGTVVLDGVKTFGTSSPEKAIYAATAIVKEIGGTIGDVFQQVIAENENEIPKAAGITLEDENGISGKVDGKIVLIGNRAILMNHGIEPPERDDVVKFTAGGKKALFIAVDGVLEAMLILSYRADKRKKIELQRMEENGISLILRSTDANITTKFINKLFGISESSISIVCGSLGDVYKDIEEKELPRADALVATKGRVESMMSVASACVRERRIMGLIVAVQNIGAILGFLLVAFLCLFSATAQLTTWAVMLYEIFWIAVVLLLPRLKMKLR